MTLLVQNLTLTYLQWILIGVLRHADRDVQNRRPGCLNDSCTHHGHNLRRKGLYGRSAANFNHSRPVCCHLLSPPCRMETTAKGTSLGPF